MSDKLLAILELEEWAMKQPATRGYHANIAFNPASDNTGEWRYEVICWTEESDSGGETGYGDDLLVAAREALAKAKP